MRREEYLTDGLRNMGGRTGQISSPRFEKGSSKGVSLMANRLS
jgi:hypothetical protein